MLIYLAGIVPAPCQSMLIESGLKYRLYSFYYDSKKLPEETWIKGPYCLWDSGGFTARKNNLPISVESYSKFINEQKIRFAFNLDTNDLQETWRNQNYLEQKTASYIIPIYHYQSWLAGDIQWLDLIKRYPYISVGGLVGQKNKKSIEAFLRFIYSQVGLKKIHFLGKTAEPILKKFPAYSADSTSWLAPCKFAQINTDKNLKNLTKYRVENFSSYARVRVDIDLYQDLERRMTSLWCHRGIHFGCPHDEQDFIARKDGHELARSLIRKA